MTEEAPVVPFLRSCCSHLDRLPVSRLAADRSGASAVMVALVITGLIGFAGLGTEAGDWYLKKRTMQGAADASAYAAALAAGGGKTAYTTQAKAMTAQYGFVDQTAGVTVTVNNPPTMGNYTTNTAAIEVIIQQPQPRLFSAFYLASNPTIMARAVATRGTGPNCVIALNGQASADAFANGTTDVNLIKCGIAVNSTSSSALDIVGGAQINADSASIVGGVSGGGTLTTVNGTFTGASPVPDPYQNVQMPNYQTVPCISAPSSGTIDATSVGTKMVDSATGETYYVVKLCGDLSLTGHAIVTLENGVFVLDGGSVKLNNSTLNVTNATVALSSSTGSYGTVSVNGGSTINATPATTGPTKGLSFFQDRNAPQGNSNNFAGSTTQNIQGVIYFPNGNVSFDGGTQTGSGCTQIVANEVDFKGNATMASNCSGYPGVAMGATAPKQVE